MCTTTSRYYCYYNYYCYYYYSNIDSNKGTSGYTALNGLRAFCVYAWANFIELLKHKICLSTKIARLFYTCYWPKFHAIYIACDWYLAAVCLA